MFKLNIAKGPQARRYYRNRLAFHHCASVLPMHYYYIDADGVLFQNYQLEMMTRRVADSNHHMVHISIEAHSKDDYSEAQIKTRDWITRNLMKELGIPADKVKGHWQVNNNSNCPGYTKEELDAYRR